MASLRQISRAAAGVGAGAGTGVPCCEAAWGGPSGAADAGAVLLTAVPRGLRVSRVSGAVENEGSRPASGIAELCAEADEVGESSGAEPGAAELLSEDERPELLRAGMCWQCRRTGPRACVEGAKTAATGQRACRMRVV